MGEVVAMLVTVPAPGAPPSVSVQVVLVTVQVTMWPVVGTEVNPRIVFDAVAALPQVVVKLPDAGNIASVPPVPLNPNVGVTLQLEAELVDVKGIAPAEGAEVALVPPRATVIVGKSPAAIAPNDPMPPEAVACSTWVVVVSVFPPNTFVVTFGKDNVTAPEDAG
jgi:hypothetical protein